MTGSPKFEATYIRGTRSAHMLHKALLPVLGRHFGRPLAKGSLNLCAYDQITFPDPLIRVLLTRGHRRVWLFTLAIINQVACGVAARRQTSGNSPFLEVFSSSHLAHALGLVPGDVVDVQLLPGEYLQTERLKLML